jgi:hypothetical protein
VFSARDRVVEDALPIVRPGQNSALVLGVALLMGVGALHAFLVELRALRNELALVREASGE